MGPATESAVTLLLLVTGVGCLAYFPFRQQWSRLRRFLIDWQKRDEREETEVQHHRQTAEAEIKEWSSVRSEESDEKP
jgi:hypothetical protein